MLNCCDAWPHLPEIDHPHIVIGEKLFVICAACGCWPRRSMKPKPQSFPTCLCHCHEGGVGQVRRVPGPGEPAPPREDL